MEVKASSSEPKDKALSYCLSILTSGKSPTIFILEGNNTGGGKSRSYELPREKALAVGLVQTGAFGDKPFV